MIDSSCCWAFAFVHWHPLCRNGNEMGVDCGGPQCPPCSTSAAKVLGMDVDVSLAVLGCATAGVLSIGLTVACIVYRRRRALTTAEPKSWFRVGAGTGTVRQSRIQSTVTVMHVVPWVANTTGTAAGSSSGSSVMPVAGSTAASAGGAVTVKTAPRRPSKQLSARLPEPIPSPAPAPPRAASVTTSSAGRPHAFAAAPPPAAHVMAVRSDTGTLAGRVSRTMQF